MGGPHLGDDRAALDVDRRLRVIAVLGDDGDRLRRLYDAYAPGYDRGMDVLDRILFPGGRDWVCGQARGRVLEIAMGTGRNLPHYPADITLVGIEQSPGMLQIARRRAGELGIDADLRLGDAQALDFPDGTFDAVVCTVSLCSIPDDARAVSEARRVLRPGGRFLLLEHVRSPVLPVRLLERLLDPLSVRTQADHLLRDPLDHLGREGFQVERVERSRLGLVERVAARVPPAEPEQPGSRCDPSAAPLRPAAPGAARATSFLAGPEPDLCLSEATNHTPRRRPAGTG